MKFLGRTSLVLLLLVAATRSAAGAEDLQPSEPRGAASANVPRPQFEYRTLWEIVFPDDITLEEYARQIDFFQIEIAAVAKSGKIEYISDVTAAKPKRHTGSESTEYRLRIGWKKGNLHAADRRLLAKAGIASDNKQLWHYFPIQAQAQLSDLEKAYAQREGKEIRRTRFEIHATKDDPDRYEFVVVEQDPPKPGVTAATGKATSENQPRATSGGIKSQVRKRDE